MKLLYKAEELSELKQKISSISNITTIKIATAFISESNELQNILLNISKENNLDKKNYEVFLGDDFSKANKFNILSFLTGFATVYIVDSLHAKAYYISGDESLFSFGSANFTDNGFSNNLELMCIDNEIDKNEIITFFDYCKSNSTLVNGNAELLEIYKDMDIESNKIENNYDVKVSNSKINKLKIKIKQIKRKETPIEYRYDNLDGYFFQKEDYEVFNNKNAIKTDSETNKQRDIVKDKLLEINKDIKDEIIRRFNLHNHYRPANVISPVNARPNPAFNNNKLVWLGIRYGRDESEIKLLNSLNNYRDSNDYYGFQKYTCFQINISYEYQTPFFEVGIFHAVPDGAVDRSHLREQLLKDKDLSLNIMEELNKLKGHGLVWTAFDDNTKEASGFEIDNRNSNEFKVWYLENVVDGKYSSLLFKILPDDLRIKKKEDIKKLIFDTFELLKPLYDLIIWKPNIK